MSRNRTSALLLAAAAATATLMAAAPTQAAPGCQLVIESGADQWMMRYEPFDQDVAVQEFDVAVVNQGDGPCTAVSRVELRGEPFGLVNEAGAQRMAYAQIGRAHV